MELYPRGPHAHIDAFVRDGERLLAQFSISGKTNRLHYFLAQIGHESGGLTITEESLYYRAERIMAVWPKRFPNIDLARQYERNPEKLANCVYSSRMGNGPEASGDGWGFRGRGYIQITGRDGYKNVGTISGLDLVGNPELATQPEHALLVACAFWQWKGLNSLCDTGTFEQVTRRINGGLNGLKDRRAWLDKVRRILSAPMPADQTPDVEKIISLQKALQASGYTEIGAADGLVGPRTLAAITHFRQKNGLQEGAIDNELMTALGLDDL